jgi:DNA-binding IclR family transcriptional regulator
MSDREPRPLAAVSRALEVLDLLAKSDEPTIGVSQLARLTGMSRAGAYRMLMSLRVGGFVEYHPDTARYGLGVGALRIGNAYQRRNGLVQIASGALRRLAEASGETSTVSVRRQRHRVYLDQIVPPNELNVTVRIGVPFPLHAGASSKAILAFLAEDEITAYLAANLESVTPQTVVDAGLLRAQLADIRQEGFAMSEQERQIGAASVAAPILARGGIVIGALSVTGPVSRMGKDKLRALADRVVAEARELSAKTAHSDASALLAG